MNRKTILYLSTNDGSDMRITKEIKSLQKIADVIFLGCGVVNDQSYCLKYCKSYILVNQRRNSVKSIVLLIFHFLNQLITNKIDSVHVINEQLAVFFYPFMFFKHSVLDIFDSIFLKKGFKKNQLILLKKIFYLPFNKIIVTDENRFYLMPNSIKSKLEILENYPPKVNKLTNRISNSQNINILYTGSLSVSRGTKLLNELISRYEDIKIIAAGWIRDHETEILIGHSQVDYRGVLSQEESSNLISVSDFMLCVYEPSNLNNINASPNKIYDAIQYGIPVIINREIGVSNFVSSENLGLVIDNYYDINLDFLYNNLKIKKGSYSINFELSNKYNWETIESKLYLSHKININETNHPIL